MSYLQKPTKHQRKMVLSPRREQGVVIVIALFIVALVATMAYTMMIRLARDTERTQLILRYTQAEAYASASVDWAIDQLRNNWEQQKPNQLIDVMPMKQPVKIMNGYHISSTIYDMQARFNLNSLSNPKSKAGFKRLMQTVYPRLTNDEAEALITAITQWISASSSSQESDRYYASLSPPYRAAHRPMQSPSELKLVKGMSPALYTALQPYVTALPTNDSLVNIQTAEAPVLMMLSPSLTQAGARVIQELRLQKPILSPAAFLAMDVVKNNRITADNMVVMSRYFLVVTEVTIEKQHVVIYTLLERNTKEQKATVTILWQSIGVW